MSRMSRIWTPPFSSSFRSSSVVTFSMRVFASATSWPMVFLGVNMAWGPPPPVYRRRDPGSSRARREERAHDGELPAIDQASVESRRAGEQQREAARAVSGMEAAQAFQQHGGDQARDGHAQRQRDRPIRAAAARLGNRVAEQREGRQVFQPAEQGDEAGYVAEIGQLPTTVPRSSRPRHRPERAQEQIAAEQRPQAEQRGQLVAAL